MEIANNTKDILIRYQISYSQDQEAVRGVLRPGQKYEPKQINLHKLVPKITIFRDGATIMDIQEVHPTTFFGCVQNGSKLKIHANIERIQELMHTKHSSENNNKPSTQFYDFDSIYAKPYYENTPEIAKRISDLVVESKVAVDSQTINEAFAKFCAFASSKVIAGRSLFPLISREGIYVIFIRLMHEVYKFNKNIPKEDRRYKGIHSNALLKDVEKVCNREIPETVHDFMTILKHEEVAKEDRPPIYKVDSGFFERACLYAQK